MPYGPIDFEASHLKASLFHGPITCLDISEPYAPDRMARQFGRVQGIPGDVIPPTRAYRLEDTSRYVVEYPNAAWAWRERHNTHRFSLESLGAPARFPRECTLDYMMWFTPRTHPVICPEDHRYFTEGGYPQRGEGQGHGYGQDYPPEQVKKR